MIIKADGKDITQLVGNITLDSNLDSLGDQLNFETAYSKEKFFPKADVSEGSIIQLFDKEEIFRGIAVSKEVDRTKQTFSCFDFAFYLNKTKLIKQFKKVQADKAIKQLLSELNVPCGTISPMTVVISKIYYDKEVSAIIKDILEEVTKATGQRYVIEMNKGKLDIIKDTELIVNYSVKLAENLAPLNINQVISNPRKTYSIEEMKNSIVIYTGGEEKFNVVASAKNDALISKYGLLQETASVDGKDVAQARNIANNMLKELGKVLVDGSVDVIGDFKLRAGRTLVLNEPITGLVGKYKIKSASHSIETVHTTKLDLVEV